MKIILLFLLLLPRQARGEEIHAVVTKITDGDTVVVEQDYGSATPLPQLSDLPHLLGSPFIVRLYGVDAPERDQPFGIQAKAELIRLISKKSVIVDTVKRDKYGRMVAKISIDGVDVSKELLRNGLAWWYRDYAPNNVEFQQAEFDAQERKVGVWSTKTSIAPWIWRANKIQERSKLKSSQP
jgi:endonuclease YncB( thermonuclease family)